MDKEILQAMVEMVKTGGQTAVWGVGIYWLMVLLKTVVITGGWILCLSQIRITLTHCWDNYQINKDRRITLISDKVSKTISDTMETFQKNTMDILKDLTEQLNKLKDSSKKTDDTKPS